MFSFVRNIGNRREIKSTLKDVREEASASIRFVLSPETLENAIFKVEKDRTDHSLDLLLSFHIPALDSISIEIFTEDDRHSRLLEIIARCVLEQEIVNYSKEKSHVLYNLKFLEKKYNVHLGNIYANASTTGRPLSKSLTESDKKLVVEEFRTIMKSIIQNNIIEKAEERVRRWYEHTLGIEGIDTTLYIDNVGKYMEKQLFILWVFKGLLRYNLSLYCDSITEAREEREIDIFAYDADKGYYLDSAVSLAVRKSSYLRKCARDRRNRAFYAVPEEENQLFEFLNQVWDEVDLLYENTNIFFPEMISYTNIEYLLSYYPKKKKKILSDPSKVEENTSTALETFKKGVSIQQISKEHKEYIILCYMQIYGPEFREVEESITRSIYISTLGILYMVICSVLSVFSVALCIR